MYAQQRDVDELKQFLRDLWRLIPHHQRPAITPTWAVYDVLSYSPYFLSDKQIAEAALGHCSAKQLKKARAYLQSKGRIRYAGKFGGATYYSCFGRPSDAHREAADGLRKRVV